MLNMLLSAFLIVELPSQWKPSYSTYQTAEVLTPMGGAFGFATHNYCLFGSKGDTTSYDLRLFDIFGRVGIFRAVDIGLRYSSPLSGVIDLKWQIAHQTLDIALDCGFGYMKATDRSYRTYFIYDIYPQVLISKRISTLSVIYGSPKIILSFYNEEDDGPEAYSIFQSGGCVGLCIGPQNVTFMSEVNYLSGNDRGRKFEVTQFGIGFALRP